MLWWYSLALTLSGVALGAICFVFPHWDLAWSAAYLAELFVFCRFRCGLSFLFDG